MIGDTGDEHTMMTVGLGVVGSLYSFGNELRLTDATPLAQLISEPEGVLVPGDSPFKTIDDLVAGLDRTTPTASPSAAGPPAVGRTTCSRCSWPQAVDIDPSDVNYVTYDGGGPLTSALLGKKIDVGFSGLAEFTIRHRRAASSGCSRSRARSGSRRPALKDVPTLTESDIDLVFLNWRGVSRRPTSATSVATS